VRIEAVSAAAVRPLRQAVLRPHQRAGELVWAGDEDPAALHAAAFDGEALLAVASVVPAPHPRDPRPGDWRVRGMATRPEARGRGLGAALLERCLEHARAHGGARAWCNARTPVIAFYERAGFLVEGEPFELPAIGPHVVMTKTLLRCSDSAGGGAPR
jgi:GNAT superfamily N-acetyltransferase